MQVFRKSILLFSISLMLLSCGQNGDVTPLTGGTDGSSSNSIPLLGSWRNYNSDSGEYFYWIFESNNKFMFGTFYESFNNVNVFACLDYFTSGSELILTEENGNQSIYRFTISGNSLTIRNISSASTTTFTKSYRPYLSGNICGTF